MAGAQLMNGHVQTPVAIDIDHHTVRAADLSTDRRREAEAHRAKPGTTEKGTRLAHLIVLHRPHLMLANAKRHQSITVSHLTQKRNSILRREFGNIIHDQWILLFEIGDVGHPFTVITRLRSVGQLPQRRTYVGADGQGYGLILVEFIAIDVDMDNRAVFDELAHFSGHTIIKTNTYG